MLLGIPSHPSDNFMFHRQNRHMNISKQSDKCCGRCWRRCWCMVQPASYCQTPICNLHTNAYVYLTATTLRSNHISQMGAQLVSQISICSRRTRLQRFKAGRGVAESRVNEVSFPKICSLECQTCACKCSLFAEMALDLIWQNVSGIPLSDAVVLVLG